MLASLSDLSLRASTHIAVGAAYCWRIVIRNLLVRFSVQCVECLSVCVCVCSDVQQTACHTQASSSKCLQLYFGYCFILSYFKYFYILFLTLTCFQGLIHTVSSNLTSWSIFLQWVVFFSWQHSRLYNWHATCWCRISLDFLSLRITLFS